ncbi:MAG: cobalamin-dependent protein [Candidatus Aminicenantes bacterium]|nr:cobalamin-dependent protein [Candidatus Aminicenantes bacterium]
MKVQLFVPPGGYFAERWTKGSSMPPLGLLYIGAVLEKAGHDIRIVPADLWKFDWRRIAGMIDEFEPDIVGVTSTTENRFQSFKLVRVAKKTRPEAFTVMGGPHASMAAEDTLAHIPELDIVVRGEGEQTMYELCQALDGKKDLSRIQSLSGISFRKNGEIITNPARPPIKDIDSIPPPAYHLVPFEEYNFRFEVPGKGMLPAVNMMSSRGCPFKCNFCATPINWGRAVRMRSPHNIVDEIEFLIRTYGVKVIFFFDDTFNTSPRRAHEICDLILERRLDIFFKCDIRIDLIDKPLLDKMKQAGLFHLSFGLEAGSERVRNEIVEKKVDIEDFHNLVQWCRELDIIPNAFFIFSHPTETWQEAQETIAIIEKYKEQIEASIAILHIYPGTPLEKTAKEMGALPIDFTWTKKYGSKIITLPAAQGDVPLFLHKLSWAQICELIFRWSISGGKVSILSKIPQVLKSMRSVGDLKRYAIMALVYFKLKVKNLLTGK